MRQFYLKHFIFLNLLILCCFFIYIYYLFHNRHLGKIPDTAERIQQSGVLRMITTNSLNTFYLYKGTPASFEYELAEAFARYLNVDLDIVTSGWNNLFTYLDMDKGDFIGAGLSITRDRLERVTFSIPYMTTQQRVVHHALIFGPRNIQDLAFRTIHAQRNTAYHSRLAELKESGIDFKYILHDNIPTEDLIAMVHDREIKFTIADSHIALLHQRHFPEIRIGIPIQEKESLAWAVRKDDLPMLKEINRFFLHAKENGILRQLVDKYFTHAKEFDVSDVKTFHDRVKSHLPEYRAVIQAEAAKYDFDWRLMAAVIYQESRFAPHAKSVTNVKGLMQVTQAAALEMGIKDRLDPVQSIKAGIKYLSLMYERFEQIENIYQRLLFALASYNVGYGHVRDAMAIAREKGLNPLAWNSLKKTLPLLTKPEFYKKTKHGYARGWDPVEYVERILTYYDILKKINFS